LPDVPPPFGQMITSIAAGGAHSLGLRLDGSLIAWGANWDGQCDVPSDRTLSQLQVVETIHWLFELMVHWLLGVTTGTGNAMCLRETTSSQ
jgi:hypothetical protein